MPVSIGEWRVRIGRFIHRGRENDIRDRKEKLLKERIRLLKLLEKRLLKKKDKSEDECESKPNDLSVKVDNAQNESTIKENTAETESTTHHKNNGTDSTFLVFFSLLLPLFTLLLSLIFFFVFDFSNLLDSYKPFLKWSGEFSWRITCLIIIIVCSSFAYIVLSYIIKDNDDLQDNLVAIKDNNVKDESTIEVNNTTTKTTVKSNNSPTESNIKENNTGSETTIKENSTPTRSTIKVINTPTASIIENNNTVTESRFKEKNTTIQSTKECKHTLMNSIIKERNTPSIIRDEPSERKTSKTTTSNSKVIKEENTITKFTIRKKSAVPESKIRGRVAPKECHINTLSTMTDKPSKRKTPKRKTLTSKRKMSKKKTAKDKKRATKTTIKANNSPTESNIKEDNMLSGSTSKEKITQTKSTLKKDNTRITESIIIENNSPNESNMKENNATTGSTIIVNNTPTESTIKVNNTPTESTIKVNNTLTESTIIENNTPTESTIKVNNTPTESTIIENNTPTESTIKVNNTPTESTIKENNSLTESTIKENNSLTESTNKNNNRSSESTIKDYSNQIEYNIKDINSTIPTINEKNNTTAESANKGSNSTKERTSKDSNTPTKSTNEENDTSKESTLKGTSSSTSIKDNGSPTESTNESNNHSSESPIKGNNSRSESTPKDSNNTSISAIKEKNTPSRTPTGEKNNQPMKVNSVKAEYTIGSGIQKVPSDRKHSISSQIPSSLKGNTDDPVMQESTCLPEMILIKAGDVEQNPGPFDRSANIHERELLNLADDVSSSKYTELCSALGVSYNQSQSILDRHLLNFTRSLHAVFFQWKDTQRDGTDCRQVMAAVLRGVNLDALGDKMSRGGYLPQEAAPNASIANEKKPLTTEQVTRCGDDFKSHYRTHLFKIKTDPLDFRLLLEFERIYTDLVLLRNEQGTTKKTPLDYKELLKTKVNGELPKRLMVEGEGGAGKTTFCSKIAWDWTNGAEEFGEFVWVLVIPLRDIERNQTVGDIAKTYLSDSNSIQPHQINEYILANPSKVFIIFDGLDEYDDDVVKQGNDIAKIIRSEKFKECRVLVTTRPWKADQIKSNANFMKTYAFIAVAGFDKRHISIYINKYFADDSQASRDLIKLIEDNDVIQENMAPFPIYIAMLCILWRDSDSKKKELIRRLKTFSQLFQYIIISLKDHFVSKQVTDLDVETVTHFKQLDFCFSQIGKIALSGIMNKKLVYGKDDFSSCEEAMETCCRVGVLSRETRLVRKQDRHAKSTNLVKASVFFPHKLFQEYIAGMYLASLFESDHEQYETDISKVIPRANEFRYLLYFTASQSKNVAIDVTKRLINMGTQSTKRHILVDIAFEACDEDSAKVVRQHLFAQEMSLHVEISDEMSAHTVSGYLFILEKTTMETLILSRRSCGPTVSRDLADVICSPTALTALDFYGTALHDDFYGTLESKVKTSKVERLSLGRMEISDEHASRNLARFLNSLPRLKDLTLQNNRFDGWFYEELASDACLGGLGASCHSVRKLHLDHWSHNDILQHGYTVERLFPNLEHLHFTTLQTVSPNIVGSFAHSGLEELSFAGIHYGQTKEDEECPVPMVGDLSSLEQVFRNSFPQLTNFTLNNLVIGNNRCKTILGSLKQHQHLQNIRIFCCYTDEELDPIVSAINMKKRMKVDIHHVQAQKCLECMKMSSSLADALCNRTSIQELILTGKTIFPNAWFSEENQRTVDSKIQKLSIVCCSHGMNDPPSLRDLATFLCLQPCLTDLTINCYSRYLHEDFYQELARLASSSKVHKLSMGGCMLKRNTPSASRDLARFLCLQPCLTDLTIDGYIYRHDDFYKELSRLASSSTVQKLSMECCNLERNNPSASRDLATFLCLQPCLTDLMLNWYNGYLHDDFYQEIARLASSSKVQKLYMGGCMLESNTPVGSRDLATFLCLQPCLTDLTICVYNYQHHDFYQELSRLASSSKVQKLSIECGGLGSNNPSASRDLATFLCHQPCLIDLTINGRNLHDDFYQELACLASSSKVQKLSIEGCELGSNNPSASRNLATFVCLQPCLTDLKIQEYHKYLPDDFYQELACLASSSKVQKLSIGGCELGRNNPSASRNLATFVCLHPFLTDLIIYGRNGNLHDDFYQELACLASSSKVRKLFIEVRELGNNPSVIRNLGTFVCLQPCLIDLTIKGYLHDAFYQELSRLASSSKVQKLSIEGGGLGSNNPSASRDLATFICLQPCLTDLTIQDKDMSYSPIVLHNEFYHEVARLASSSKIQKLSVACYHQGWNDPSTSRDLARFLCLQPWLIDLTIRNSYTEYRPMLLHDEFYHKLACLASYSKVQKLSMECCNLERNDPSASRDLARFLCLQPCLTDLTIWINCTPFRPTLLHDEFYHELACLASSSKIQKLSIEHFNTEGNDPSASRNLARFLCLLPCLTDLTLTDCDDKGKQLCLIRDDFYHELACQASSSKNHFFTKKLHLDERSEDFKRMDLRQQCQYVRRLVHPTLSEETSSPTSRAPEPLSSHKGSVQQQTEYSSVVTPPDLDVPSTSSINAQSGKIAGPSAVSRGHLQPKGEGIAHNHEPHSTDEDDTRRGDHQTKSHGSEDGNLDGRPRKRKKKTNRKTDSTDEDERTRGDKQTKSHDTKDDSLDGRPRKRKKKTNRKTDSTDED